MVNREAPAHRHRLLETVALVVGAMPWITKLEELEIRHLLLQHKETMEATEQEQMTIEVVVEAAAQVETAVLVLYLHLLPVVWVETVVTDKHPLFPVHLLLMLAGVVVVLLIPAELLELVELVEEAMVDRLLLELLALQTRVVVVVEAAVHRELPVAQAALAS